MLIVCDLGGVVIRIEPGRVHRRWAAMSGRPVAEVRGELFPDPVYEALERGDVAPERYLDHVAMTLGLPSTEGVAEVFNDIYSGVDDGVLAVLRNVAGAGHTVAALTNTNVLHHETWWPLYRDRLDAFEAIHLSFELGARKPERECFQRVLALHDATPGEAVFIDDSPVHVTAARRLGVPSLHFTTATALADGLRAMLPPR